MPIFQGFISDDYMDEHLVYFKRYALMALLYRSRLLGVLYGVTLKLVKTVAKPIVRLLVRHIARQLARLLRQTIVSEGSVGL